MCSRLLVVSDGVVVMVSSRAIRSLSSISFFVLECLEDSIPEEFTRGITPPRLLPNIDGTNLQVKCQLATTKFRFHRNSPVRALLLLDTYPVPNYISSVSYPLVGGKIRGLP